MKKNVGIAILLSLGLSVSIAFIEPENIDGWYELAGLGFFISGIWGAILLIRK